MFTKDEMKKKYAAEFDRNKNYQKIMKPRIRQVPKLTACFACVLCICVMLIPQLNQKKDLFVAEDSMTQELGPEIILNINLPQERELKETNLLSDLAPALKANVELKRAQSNEEYMFLNDLCPVGFVSSEPVLFETMEDERTVNDYLCIEYVSQEKSIRLSWSKKNWPLRCYVLSPDEEISVLDGIEMLISHDSEAKLYLSLFEMNDMYFDVETSSLSESELIEFLLRLVKNVRSAE